LEKLKLNILPKQCDFPSIRCTKKDTARSEQYLQENCTETMRKLWILENHNEFS